MLLSKVDVSTDAKLTRCRAVVRLKRLSGAVTSELAAYGEVYVKEFPELERLLTKKKPRAADDSEDSLEAEINRLCDFTGMEKARRSEEEEDDSDEDGGSKKKKRLKVKQSERKERVRLWNPEIREKEAEKKSSSEILLLSGSLNFAPRKFMQNWDSGVTFPSLSCFEREKNIKKNARNAELFVPSKQNNEVFPPVLL